ncbi:DUF881 domain-containing protein [Nocardioides sp. CFH 31398]|uniref:DUF881 domain-containing protein n=1 Tax=Nocardioides sp. CFH 31398 TaxID=2919579 RepID=UPI001F05918A|nr:DUF881 domain-containing protein [Nocardioides sp. CFH 31398]MCH1866982.1 DUF881 domain-containing protein [Nocardioides sp. CFH 31398]
MAEPTASPGPTRHRAPHRAPHLPHRPERAERPPRDDVPAPPLPAHVTTPLLDLLTAQALDEDYAVAARRRAEAAAATSEDDGGTADAGPPRRRAGLPALVAVAVLGMLITVAAVETDRGRGAQESDRAGLIEEAELRRDALGEQQDRLAELRDANVTDAAALADLTATEESFDTRLARLRSVTGYGAVTGPGVRLTFEDPPDGDPADDMTQVLDGLWNAGAEAVAINGRRIGTLTRVASTGPAVSLDGRSLDPPYVVEAIGDPQTMPARFAESSSGAEFTQLSELLFFDVQLETVDELELPAASLPPGLDLGADDERELPERSTP